MRTNPKLRTVLIIYTIIFYGLWNLLELYLKTKIGIDEFTKEVYFKCVLWLIPAILIHFSFSNHMFSKKEEMYSLNKNTTLSKSLAIASLSFSVKESCLTGQRLCLPAVAYSLMKQGNGYAPGKKSQDKKVLIISPN